MTVDREPSGRTRALRFAARMCARGGLLGALQALSNRVEVGPRVLGVPLARRRRSRGVLILTYHRVRSEPDPYLPAMPVEDFARQMECLKRRFRVGHLEDLLECVERDDVPDDAVAITFDDGYRDNFDCAFPILRALDLPATFFLVTGAISGRSALWHDRVFRAFSLTTAACLERFGDSAKSRRLGSPDERDATRDAVLGYLKTLHPTRRDSEIDDLVRRLGVPDAEPPQRLMLEWDEVASMRRGGCRFGAHTVSHPVLSRLSLDEARHELSASRLAIEERLGEPCRVLAYPNGKPADYSPTIHRLAHEVGYRWVLSTVFGVHRSRRADVAEAPFPIPRMAVGEAEPALYTAKLTMYRFFG